MNCLNLNIKSFVFRVLNVFIQAGSFTDLSPNPDPEKVPEPASVLGLLAVGAFGAGSTLKRKKKQLV
jgi:hypothetical protein